MGALRRANRQRAWKRVAGRSRLVAADPGQIKSSGPAGALPIRELLRRLFCESRPMFTNGLTMPTPETLAHLAGDSQIHALFIPKYLGQALSAELRRDIGSTFFALVEQRGQ